MNEFDAIATAIQHYIEGARSGSSVHMRAAFHEHATIFGYEDGQLFAGPIQRLYDWHDENGAAPAIRARIVNTDVAGTVATARLEIENWTGTDYVDFFTMLKVGDSWKIMNKVFHIRSTRSWSEQQE